MSSTTDLVRQWVAQAVRVTPAGETRTDAAYVSFADWCRHRGIAHHQVPSAMRFGPALTEVTGCPRRQVSRGGERGYYFLGLMLEAAPTRRVFELAAEIPVAASWVPDAASPLEATIEDKDTDRARREAEERDRRRASNFEPMRPEDFDDEWDLSIGNAAESPMNRAERSKAAREKRQEFNRNMGEFANAVRGAIETAPERGGTIADGIAEPEKHAKYIRTVAEQENRFLNRRGARSLSLAEAHEQMNREAMIFIAQTYFRDKIEPRGYARLPAPDHPGKRTACLLLSDLHLGSELDSVDEPVTFLATQEARRLEYLLRQFVDYKPRYRDDTDALLILNGDIIEGQLMHDFRSGSPLAEQKWIFWRYFVTFIAHVAECYPRVRVVCQPGNHGRDKVRHPGRATARKWDGHEWEMYVALEQMCSGLKNVTWSIPQRAISIIDLHGSKIGATHADTEIKLGDPDTKSTDNARILDRINAIGLYRDEFGAPVHFDGWVFGHYHKARYQPRNPRVLWNAALVPPNGYARSAGYIGEPQGQWMWEAVEGYPIGDVRFVEVGEAQDNDERLGKLIEPQRLALHKGSHS